MKVLNFRINGIRDYYQTFYSIMQPFTPMSAKEASVLATIMELRHTLEIESTNWKDIVKEEVTDFLKKEHGLSRNYISVIKSALRKKGIINGEEIKKAYVIDYEKSGGILFSLKQQDEIS